MTPLEQARDAIKAQISQDEKKLAQLQTYLQEQKSLLASIEQSILRAGEARAGVLAQTGSKAPPNALKEAILGVLDSKSPMKRARIIELLQQTNYPYSLNPTHVTKYLAELAEDKKVKTSGKFPHLEYTKK